MFKKTITFEDFNGIKQTQDFYFHLSKADLLAMATDGNAMMARIQGIIDAKDGKAILSELRDFIELAAGLRSEDGSRFIKTSEAKSVLMDSPAFDELLMELATNTDASVEFVQQLIPQKMQDELKAQLEKNVKSDQAVPDPFKEQEDLRPAWMKEHRHPTKEELLGMSAEELKLAFRNRTE